MDDEAPAHFHLEVAYLQHPNRVVARTGSGQPVPGGPAPPGPEATVARVLGDPPPEPSTAARPPSRGVAAPAARLFGAVVDSAVLEVVGIAMIGAGGATVIALSTVAYLAYEIAMVVTRGQTLGKMALGTVVTDAAGGGRPTLWQATTRAVVPLAGVVVDVILGTAAVGALWVFAVYGSLLVDERRRGLHDRAAGTLVVSRPRSLTHRKVGVVVVVAAAVLTLATAAVAMRDAADPPGAATGLSAAARR